MKFQFSPLSATILDFSGKWKSVNISKTVRDRAISSEFLTHRVVQECPVQRGKFQFSPLSAASWIFAENEKVSISRQP